MFNLTIKSKILITMVILASPLFVFAQEEPIDSVVKCIDGGSSCTLGSFMATIQSLVNVAISVAIATSAITISYAGFLYLTAGGDPGKIKEGHTILKMTAIGLIIILLAWLFLDLLFDVIGVKSEFNPLKPGPVQVIS
jgi:hypothetical protein